MSDERQRPSPDAGAPSPAPAASEGAEPGAAPHTAANAPTAARGAEPGAAPAGEQLAWQPLDVGGLRNRLAEVKRLLEQAAALAAAQDTSRIETMTALIQQGEEQARGGAVRRRYR